MGSPQNSAVAPDDKRQSLKEAGRLSDALDKPIEQYSAVDHHELDQAFDKMLLDVRAVGPAPEAQEKPAHAEESEKSEDEEHHAKKKSHHKKGHK